MNSLLGDPDLRERLFERPPAERRLSERAAVELAEADRAAAERAADERAAAERAVERARDRAERKPVIERPGLLEVLAASGAILIVGLGLAFVFVITLVSLGTVPD